MKIIKQISSKTPLFKDSELHEVVERLCHPESYSSVYHRVKHQEVAMPSTETLSEIVELLKSVIFPGYFLNSDVNPGTMKYYIGSTLDRVMRLLSEQVKRGFCFFCSTEADKECHDCENKAAIISHRFVKSLPELRELLALDALAAFEGDPAAQKLGETIFCYPSITAMTYYRIAHELYKHDVPLIPRIITEMAHSHTGIDIHPGAQIGRRFFIDHGTGTVIGETCIIGENVRIYQGVTLGAKSFPIDEKGNPIKGIPRHPVVEDDVIIYSGATILGRVTIGKGAEIGGNVWITTSIEPGAKIIQQKALKTCFEDGAGI
ncbi:MAG: serine acetyltransferase [Spirochaetae bacterium HGW-Spirochaetae-1]|jgi:serine O-acetyltransferase|nr:MAG: serine acetyltransferase [Spirochaetae bacterium HGW-Spirochaetae-1]